MSGGSTAMYVMAGAAAALSAYSAVSTAQAQKAAGKYDEEVAEQNAEINKRAGIDAQQRGADEAAQIKDRARRIAASQRAGAAAGGVTVDTGSALDLLTETAGMGELDALTRMNNAQREAYGYQVQGMNNKAQGKLARYRGNSQARGTLLTGATNIASMGYSSFGRSAAASSSAASSGGGYGFGFDQILQ